MKECALALDRSYNAVSMISSTDMFKRYLDERKAQWRDCHDFQLAAKLHEVAGKGLDLILNQMEKKGDQIPMQRLESLTTSALTNLGYGQPVTPAVQVNNFQQDNRQQVMVSAPVSAAALEEARDALRSAERKRALDSPVLDLPAQPPLLENNDRSEFLPRRGRGRPRKALLGGVGTEAELVTSLDDDDGEDLSAPLTLSAQ